MTEAERIESIKSNGGRHLQNFKEKNITYAMCLVAVELDGTAFYMVPDQYRTEEVYELACKTHGSILRVVPEEFMSKEICEYAVSSDGLAIEYVPEKFKTRDMFLLAACNNPLVMQKMPVEYLNAEFCVAVVEKYGNTAISSLPKTHKNGKFFLELVEKLPNLIWNIPKSCRTAAVSRKVVEKLGYKTTAAAVKDNPRLLSYLHTSLYDHDACIEFLNSEFFQRASENKKLNYNHGECDEFYIEWSYEELYSLKHMVKWTDVCAIIVNYFPRCISITNEELLTYEICLTAVKKHGACFSYVPARYKTHELCMAALETSPSTILEFPEEYISEETCVQAVSDSSYVLEKLPAKFITYKVCLAAVKNNGEKIKFVPKELLDEELCVVAMENLGNWPYKILENIPTQFRSYQVCLAAVKKDSNSFAFVPEEHKTYELCLAAAQRGASIADLPIEYYTEEMCFAIIQHDEEQISNLPKHCLTESLVAHAVYKNSHLGARILKNIPKENITQEICNAAIKASTWCLENVPEEFVTEEILMNVASRAPGRLSDNFPERFRNKEFISKMIEAYPSSEYYLKKYLETKPVDPNVSTYKDETTGTFYTCKIVDGVLVRCDAKGCKQVDLPKGISKIVRAAFFYNDDIESVIVPEGVIEIENEAFIKCKSLKRIELPSTVSVFSLGRQDDFDSLEKIIVSENNPIFSSCDGVLYNKSKTLLIRCPQRYKNPCFVVAETVQSIQDHAFYKCNNIQEIVLPNHHIDFGDFCFGYCSSLKKVNLPEDLEKIPYGMFLMSGIEEVTVPDRLKVVGCSAFRYSKLKSFDVPAGLQEIGSHAFMPCNLKELLIPLSITSYVPENAFNECKIKFAVGFPENSYIDFEKDYHYLEAFTRICIKETAINDAVYMAAIQDKSLLKRHLLHVAATRLFVDTINLDESAKAFYEGIIKSNRKKAIVSFAQTGNIEYIKAMIDNKYATKKDIKNAVDGCDEPNVALILESVLSAN